MLPRWFWYLASTEIHTGIAQKQRNRLRTSEIFLSTVMLYFLYHTALRNFRTYILGFLHLSICKTSVFSLVPLALLFYKNPAFILICNNIPRSAKEIKKNLKPMESVSHTCENPAFHSTVCSEAIYRHLLSSLPPSLVFVSSPCFWFFLLLLLKKLFS